MDLGLLIAVVLLGAVSVGLVVYSVVSGAFEAWDISRLGWARGHHDHHMIGVRHR